MRRRGAYPCFLPLLHPELTTCCYSRCERVQAIGLRRSLRTRRKVSLSAFDESRHAGRGAISPLQGILTLFLLHALECVDAPRPPSFRAHAPFSTCEADCFPSQDGTSPLNIGLRVLQSFLPFVNLCIYIGVAAFQGKWKVGPSGLTDLGLFFNAQSLLHGFLFRAYFVPPIPQYYSSLNAVGFQSAPRSSPTNFSSSRASREDSVKSASA